jgi:hypothetical protein
MDLCLTVLILHIYEGNNRWFTWEESEVFHNFQKIKKDENKLLYLLKKYCWCNFWFGDVASSGTSLRLCLGLQNKKDPPGVGRRSLLRRSSQSSVCMKRRERERERARENNRFCPNNFLYSLLYPCMLYVYFAPVKHKAQWRRLISSLTWFDWSHKYWRLPATKDIFGD